MMSRQDLAGRRRAGPRRSAWTGCLLVAVLVPGAYVGMAVGLGLVVSQPLLATLIADAVVAAGVLLARRRRPEWFAFDPVLGGRSRVRGARAAELRWACLAVMCLVLAFAAGQVSALWIGEIADTAGPANPSTSAPPPAVVGMTFTLLVAPIAEEALMRGLMYPLLRRFVPPLPAIVLVTLCFAGLHTNLPQAIGTIGLGLLLAVIYERTRRLWPVVALHALFNTLALLAPGDQLARIANGPAAIALTLAFSAVMCLLVHRAVAHRPKWTRRGIDTARDRQGQR